MAESATRRPAQVDRGFVVRGVVDGRPCVARWSDGRLTADAALMRRAEIVVALGEQFVDHDDPSSVIPAGLESPRGAVLLTVVRAFSQVTAVELSLR